MSALTPVAGYPVHRVATFQRKTNKYGALFTDWTAACGAEGFVSGHGPLGRAGSARRLELCTGCFPARNASGPFPEPTELEPVVAR
jgi:hypothetical protein